MWRNCSCYPGAVINVIRVSGWKVQCKTQPTIPTTTWHLYIYTTTLDGRFNKWHQRDDNYSRNRVARCVILTSHSMSSVFFSLFNLFRCLTWWCIFFLLASECLSKVNEWSRALRVRAERAYAALQLYSTGEAMSQISCHGVSIMHWAAGIQMYSCSERFTLVGGELQQLWFSTTKFKVASRRHVRELVVKIRMNMRGKMQRAEKKTTLTFGPRVVLPCCASVTATVQSPRLRALIVRSHVSHPISLSPTKASAHSSGNCTAERLSLIKM